MFNRWSAVMLVAGALAGYAVAAPATGAQSQDVPFAIGDRVSLRLDSDAEATGVRDFTCVVGTLQGRWVRCDSTDPFRPRGGEVWYSLESVLRIQKPAR
jgi:hypothetical protein